MFFAMKNLISEMARGIDASGIRKVFALAAELKDPVNFSIGQPDFDVPDEIKAEAIKAIEAGQNKYSQTGGLIELREKIAAQAKEEFGWSETCTLVTSGVSGSLLLSFMSLINPGDEVVMADPYFVIYKHVIGMLGGVCVFVDSYPDFKLPVEKIAEAISDKTKFILINSPCNPTGAVYSEDELKAVAEVAASKNILIISDEIYEKFSYDLPRQATARRTAKCPSVASFYENTLVLRGLSKSYGMPGWRLGYVFGSGAVAPIVEEMTKLQQYTFVCAPTPFQAAAIAALDYDVSELVAAYRKKRDVIYEGLKDKFELARGGGAFYAFVKAPNGTATEFAERAIKNNLLIIPGQVFSEKDTHFRISYATSDEKIKQGVDILNKI